MDTSIADGADRRLIEEWLPVNELSVDAIREGGALAGHPPVNQLHVWWARRPLVFSRAAVAASLLTSDADHDTFIKAMGTSRQVVIEKRLMDAYKARGEWSNVKFSSDRAFKHNPTHGEVQWVKENSTASDPLILDITAGGGSIPFETSRLGLRTHANDLNPVATLILRATCEWPQVFGSALLNHYDEIQLRFQNRVDELLAGIYSTESLPEDLIEHNRTYQWEIETSQIEAARRLSQAYLWARTVNCNGCNRVIPLSPNWRLDSDNGKGIRLILDEDAGSCSFEIVETASEQSLGTISNGIATCPYPSCGVTSRYLQKECK